MQKIHFKAPNCWINDPNGFIWYQGQYHLFYQCFPYALQWQNALGTRCQQGSGELGGKGNRPVSYQDRRPQRLFLRQCCGAGRNDVLVLYRCQLSGGGSGEH